MCSEDPINSLGLLQGVLKTQLPRSTVCQSGLELDVKSRYGVRCTVATMLASVSNAVRKNLSEYVPSRSYKSLVVAWSSLGTSTVSTGLAASMSSATVEGCASLGIAATATAAGFEAVVILVGDAPPCSVGRFHCV